MGRSAYLSGRPGLTARWQRIPVRQPALRHGPPDRRGAPRRGARAAASRCTSSETGDDLRELARRRGRRRARDGRRRRLARAPSRTSRSSATCPSSASRSGRGTTSPATSGSTATTRSRALAAFDGGVERRVDVGRVGERLFLNNVSLGLYARLVHRREHHRRRRDALARLRALGADAAGPPATPALHDRRRARAGAARPRREQRLQRSSCSRSGSASGSTRGSSTSTSRTASAGSRGRSAACTELEIGAPQPRLGGGRRRAGRARHAGRVPDRAARATRARAARARVTSSSGKWREGELVGRRQLVAARTSAARRDRRPQHARRRRSPERARSGRARSGRRSRLDPDAEELVRLDLEPGLLAQLADEARRAGARPPRGTRRGGPRARGSARSARRPRSKRPSRSTSAWTAGAGFDQTT